MPLGVGGGDGIECRAGTDGTLELAELARADGVACEDADVSTSGLPTSLGGGALATKEAIIGAGEGTGRYVTVIPRTLIADSFYLLLQLSDNGAYDFFGNLIPLALMHLEEPVPQT